MRKYCLGFVIIAIVMSLNSCNTNNSANQQMNDDNKFLVSVDTADANNNFYDNEETFELQVADIEISGEVANPGKVDFSKLPLRSVIVKETLLDENGDRFVGAYRYDGYSLFDILNNIEVAKNNAEEFPPIIDQYVEVTNNAGEKVVFSWGEIYYPNHLHEIIIATKVMRIVPSKTNELWPLPEESKVVVVSDLITERNISSPTKITVKSYVLDVEIEKGKDPMYAPQFDWFTNNEKLQTYTSQPAGFDEITLHTIFYGRGRGIHSTQPFTGVCLKEFVSSHQVVCKEALQTGLVVVAADDGYRSVFSYSEICNRNDQADILLIHCPEMDNGGAFRLFPSCDFFSDRAVKSVKGIYYSQN
jgi:hypothetical protein